MKSDAQIMAEIRAEHDAVIRKAIAQVMGEIADLLVQWEADRQRRSDRGGS